MKEMENLCNALENLPLQEWRDWDLKLGRHGIPKGAGQLISCLRAAMADPIEGPRKAASKPEREVTEA